MKKDLKQQKVEDLRAKLLEARTVILSGFEGLTVAQDYELRRKLAEVGAKYQVAKNTIIERALEGTPAAPVASNLRGTTSLAYTVADPVALAKTITTYAKGNAVLVFKAGMVEGRLIDLQELNALAALPSREALFAKVLFLINSSAQRVASVVAATGRNVACVIQQGVEQKKFREPASS